jgi:hypothetical protein
LPDGRGVVVEVLVVVEGVGGVDVVVVVVGGGAAAGAHDSVTFTIPSFTGSDSAESGVPGGMLSVKVSFAPPTTVTVTTH